MLRLLESRLFWLLLGLIVAWLILRRSDARSRGAGARTEERAAGRSDSPAEKGEDEMAKRYGGRHSPDGRGPAAEAAGLRPVPAGDARPLPRWRTSIVTLAATPLLLGAFFGSAGHLAMNLIAFAVIAGAMALTHQGLLAEAAYGARSSARRPAVPRKLFGMAALGLGLGIAAWEPGFGLAPALIVAAVGMVLHRLGFGGDPMRDKGMEGLDGVQHERVTRITEEGEAHLRAMTEAILSLRDRALELRVAHFAATARELFRRVQDNPTALASARRYLGVYLMGARDATIKFAGQYTALTDAGARAGIRGEYEALLDDLEANFAARSDAVLAGGREDLEIEVQVLRERLSREGVRLVEPNGNTGPESIKSDPSQP